MMGRFIWASAAIALAISSPASAQQVRTYSCTDQASGKVTQYKIGPGLLEDFENDKWSDNWCSDASECSVDGAKFSAQLGGAGFTYDASTGAYSYDDISGDTEAGTCTSE